MQRNTLRTSNVQVALGATGKHLKGHAAARAHPGGFALRSKRGPPRKTADGAERGCRCPTVVAQPGAAKLQQLHHVPVMLRRSGADPPARLHQSAVCTRLSSWGDFPIFWVVAHSGYRRRPRGRLPTAGQSTGCRTHTYRDGWHTNAVPCAAAPSPTRVMSTDNARPPRSVNRRRSASGSTSTPRTRISSDPQSSALKA